MLISTKSLLTGPFHSYFRLNSIEEGTSIEWILSCPFEGWRLDMDANKSKCCVPDLYWTTTIYQLYPLCYQVLKAKFDVKENYKLLSEIFLCHHIQI